MQQAAAVVGRVARAPQVQLQAPVPWRYVQHDTHTSSGCRFHHIASPKKRRAMAAWSSDLKVGGYSKVGYPGVLILEGESEAVEEYVALLRSQRWKAMAVRGGQQVRTLPSAVLGFAQDQHGCSPRHASRSSGPACFFASFSVRAGQQDRFILL